MVLIIEPDAPTAQPFIVSTKQTERRLSPVGDGLIDQFSPPLVDFRIVPKPPTAQQCSMSKQYIDSKYSLVPVVCSVHV